MELFDPDEDLEEQFQRFERAAAKGHKESIWMLSVANVVEMEKYTLKEAFGKTEEPLGYYFAARLLGYPSQEQFDFYKKSAEGGCSWGQVEYALSFKGWGVENENTEAHVEWLEKAANQNNPRAMQWLGDWFRWEVEDKQKAVSYHRAGAELGWKMSMDFLSQMLGNGEGCAKDLRQATVWGAKGPEYCAVFWMVLAEAERALEEVATQDLDCDFDQLCYLIGWGLYWYQYGGEDWNWQPSNEDQVFGLRCLDFYCSCVELQQKSIFTFLLFWNRTTRVKGPGQMIAQMVWEGREENLVVIEYGDKEDLQEKPALRRSIRLKRISEK
jgi:hypothetical protein